MNFSSKIYKMVLVVVFFFAATNALFSQAEYYGYQDLDEYHGIDVSNHQGYIDWKSVAKDENVQFVYIKATEGATYVSPTFEQNIEGARKAGLKVGCYHFLRSTSYIHDQFKNFITYCREEEQDLAPLIDIEVTGHWTAKQVADSLQLFADMLEDYYGARPIIYTGTNFYNKYLSKQFYDYKLFIAKYSDTEPVLCDGTSYTLWQFTDSGNVDGIRTDVDQSRFNMGKSIEDILFKPVPRDPNVIARVRVVKPRISLNMQTSSQVRSAHRDRAARIHEQQRKEEYKNANKKHSSTQKERPRRSDIDDEDDYMPTH